MIHDLDTVLSYSELIQAIERDHKGIRRKAAKAFKENPTKSLKDRIAGQKTKSLNIFDEMENLMEQTTIDSYRHTPYLDREDKYALTKEDNSNTLTIPKSSYKLPPSVNTGLADADFEF